MGPRSRRLSLWGMAALLVVIMAPPVAALVVGSFRSYGGLGLDDLTLSNYQTILDETLRGGLNSPLVTSVIFALGSATFALTVGGLLAFAAEKTNMAAPWLAYVVSIGIIAVPTIVYAIGWSVVFGRNGLVESGVDWVNSILGTGLPVPRIDNLLGMIVVEGANYAPLAFLLLVGPMRSIDAQLEEAATVSGASAWQTFRRIYLPLLLPATVAVLFLTVIRTLEAFAVPTIIGMPAGIRVATTHIYEAGQRIPSDYGVGSAYGVVLIVAVIGFLWAYTGLSARASRYQTIGGQGHRSRRVKLGVGRYLLLASTVLYGLLFLALPISALALASVQRIYAGPSIGDLTIRHYERLLRYPALQDAFVNSILVAAVTATVILAISFGVSWIGQRRADTRGRRALDLLASLPLVFPGIVVGLSLLQLYARLPVPIYGTLAILVLSYVTRFIPWGVRFTDPGVMSIGRELEESGQVCGAGTATIFRRITLPLIGVPLVAGWAYLFLITARELEASIMLVTPRTQVVAPFLLSLWENGSLPQIGAFSMLVIAIFGSLGVAVHLVANRYGRW